MVEAIKPMSVDEDMKNDHCDLFFIKNGICPYWNRDRISHWMTWDKPEKLWKSKKNSFPIEFELLRLWTSRWDQNHFFIAAGLLRKQIWSKL